MTHLETVLATFAALSDDMASGCCMSGGEETYTTWDAAITLQLDLWQHDATLAAEMIGMTVAEQWQFVGENLDCESCERIAAKLDSSPLGIILDKLSKFHAAVDAPGDDDVYWNEVDATIGDVQDLAPEWFRVAQRNDILYGTGLAGDPSLWDPHEVAELGAMLAIGSL